MTKIKQVPVTFKAGPEDGLAEGEFKCYPSTFTRKPDSYGDVVAPGAFLEDIAARKEAGFILPGLYGHRMDDPDFFVAAAIEETEDEHGWLVHGAFDLDSPKGPQVYRLVKGRRLNQLSFAYDTLEEGKTDIGDGETANELRKLKVYEFSFVPIGANQDTSVVAVKDAVSALVAESSFAAHIKRGRVLSAKNETALKQARDSIDSVLGSLGDDEDGKGGAPASPGNTDQGNGQRDTDAKSDATDEDPSGDKSAVSDEEPKSTPSVDNDLAAIDIAISERMFTR